MSENASHLRLNVCYHGAVLTAFIQLLYRVRQANPLFHMALSVQKRGLACRTRTGMNCLGLCSRNIRLLSGSEQQASCQKYFLVFHRRSKENATKKPGMNYGCFLISGDSIAMGWTGRDRFLAGVSFCFLHKVQSDSGARAVPAEGSSNGIKPNRSEANHLPPSCAEVEKGGAIPPHPPYIFKSWCLSNKAQGQF
jgi:hypothetical protein